MEVSTKIIIILHSHSPAMCGEEKKQNCTSTLVDGAGKGDDYQIIVNRLNTSRRPASRTVSEDAIFPESQPPPPSVLFLEPFSCEDVIFLESQPPLPLPSSLSPKTRLVEDSILREHELPPPVSSLLSLLSSEDAMFLESQPPPPPPPPSSFPFSGEPLSGEDVIFRESQPPTLLPPSLSQTLLAEDAKLSESRSLPPPPSLFSPKTSLGEYAIFLEKMHKKKQALDEARCSLLIEELELEVQRYRLALQIHSAVKIGESLQTKNRWS